jgi:hypothetical protein
MLAIRALSKVTIGAIFAGWLACAMSQTANEAVVEYDSVRISGKLADGHTPFSVYLRCTPSPEATTAAAPTVEYLGTDGEAPNCIVQAIAVSLNGKPVGFSAKRYADLANVALPRGVYLTMRGETVVLHVLGGDGAAAYKARYLIERQRLVGREIERLNEKGETQVSKQPY